MTTKTVLVFGATGYLGSKVVKYLSQRENVHVKAFVRPTSKKESLTALGVELVEGNLLDRSSIDKAFSNQVDFVIYCAATYMGRRKGDVQAQDMVAFTNAADASADAGVKRFVVASIVACEKAVSVPHFYDKFLQEQYLRKKGLPFISIRAPAFLDHAPGEDFISPCIKQNYVPLMIFGPDVKTHIVHTDDYASALCRSALDLPDDALGLCLNVANEEQVNWTEIAAEFSLQLERRIVPKAPVPFLSVILPVISRFNSFAHDMYEMLKFFDSGKYIVTDWTESKKYLGQPPSLKATIAKFIADKKAEGEDLSEIPPSLASKVVPPLLVAGLAAGAYYYWNNVRQQPQ